jgi:transposase
MKQMTMIAIDLAKQVFQIHGVDTEGQPCIRRQLRRGQLLTWLTQQRPCVVAMEACRGAHHWARRLVEMGHEVRLIPPQHVKAFVRGQKNDRNDAAAICEAASRPDMRTVAIKSIEQQQILALHRLRQLLVKQRTAMINQIRGLLSEFGIVMPQGRHTLSAQLAGVLETTDNGLPDLLRAALADQRQWLRTADERVEQLTTSLRELARSSAICRALEKLPGVGPLISTAFVAEVGSPQAFKNGRQVAAWLGLVPRQHSSGGKPRLFGISKRGDPYLRCLLVHGARAMLRVAGRRQDALSRWVLSVEARRGRQKAIVAMANKNARRLWATWRYAEIA